MLNVENLSCQKGYHLLFKNLSFSVATGNILRISGTNGSGKTSLLKILAGLQYSETGQINFNNHTVKSTSYQSDVLYLGHLPALDARLSVLENLVFLTRLNTACSTKKILQSLDLLGLKGYENEPCITLSAGQKRRVILASLLTSNAKLWLLDEPFTALDAKGVSIIERCIENHCAQGGVCLFTTHQESSLKNQQVLTL